jgi:peroxiredoxin
VKITKRRRAFLGVHMIAVLFFVVYLVMSRVPFEQRKPAVGEKAPAVSLADLSGNMVSLSDYDGQVVLVNFWASWCPPCKSNMRGFQNVYEQYQEKGFTVIGISLDDIAPDLLMDMGIMYPVVKTNKRVSESYGSVADVPVSFLIGKDRKIVKKVKKGYPEKRLRDDVEKALNLR